MIWLNDGAKFCTVRVQPDINAPLNAQILKTEILLNNVGLPDNIVVCSWSEIKE